MKIQSAFQLRMVGTQAVIVACGVENVNFGKIISLNSSAMWLWQELLETDFSVVDVTQKLVDRYRISYDIAYSDATALVESLCEIGLVK